MQIKGILGTPVDSGQVFEDEIESQVIINLLFYSIIFHDAYGS